MAGNGIGCQLISKQLEDARNRKILKRVFDLQSFESLDKSESYMFWSSAGQCSADIFGRMRGSLCAEGPNVDGSLFMRCLKHGIF
ncbi:hypothetical protein Pyn_16996 [Prunus yedoensis var. nudiflora]|uniref:Uncharacterized protein n=1 Tax=Prunus yedoensis var. nudiflora TaxID=2094558 RepID=A0A314YBQ6_PRUYE|nr:hypothetical protein Pyn_16996 [Prunus yedoensis var. nudiflora]